MADHILELLEKPVVAPMFQSVAMGSTENGKYSMIRGGRVANNV